MELQVSVKNQSIESSGITNDYKEAICEYIWNGFEAHATKIDVEYSINEAYGISCLSITDNGDGIVYEDIRDTFGAFLTSQKNMLSLQMKSKANKGKGRFSFSAFSSSAKWFTTYKTKEGLKDYEIILKNDKKEIVSCTEPKNSLKSTTGTRVVFDDLYNITSENMALEEIEPTLLREFAWFLYLYKEKNVMININGKSIDIKKHIDTDLSEKLTTAIDKKKFEITLIVWTKDIKESYCCYYFDNNDELKDRETTSFNRNNVEFNHSVFVKSEFFNDKDECQNKYSNNQLSLFISEEDKKTYKTLKKFVTKFIENKMKTYMSRKADDTVQQMINIRKTFPVFSNDDYGKMRKKDLERVTKEIIKIEPKIFHKLKPIQEKSLLGFLNLLLNSEERENVLSIIEQIVELSPEQRKDFSEMLQKTKLENIIDSIKFVQDRYKVIELLRTIVYDMTQFTNERNHIQKIVEQHFWLFGEQYNLASNDMRMQKALERYTNILYGEDNVDVVLKEDMEQERRMDIFMCNVREVENQFGATLEENIVVELKAPKVPLSKKVLRQIEDYMDFIKKQPSFNSEYRRWKFMAICKEVDDDVKTRYTAFEGKGKIGLVFKSENYEVYALTWDDIFKSFELIHSPLLKRLQFNRDQLAKDLLHEVEDREGRAKVDVLTELAVERIKNVN